MEKFKIALYGGAFSPWTEGHTYCVRKSLEAGMDKVIIIPAADRSPKKKLPFKFRKECIELGLLSLPEDLRTKVVISLYETKFDLDQNLDYEDATSYSVLNVYKAIYEANNINREIEMYAIYGDDNLVEIPMWKEGKELINNYNLIIFKRDYIGLDKIVSQYFFKDLKHMIILEANPIIISSTKLRERLIHGLDIADLVNEHEKELLENNIKKVYDSYVTRK